MITFSHQRIFYPLVAVLLAFGGSVLPADTKEEPKPRAIPPAAKKTIEFVKHIKPILDSRCISCHGEDAQEGRLRLDSKSLVAKGGISGALFKIGKSEKSLLLQRLVGHGDGDAMPLDDEPLSDEQVSLIRAWIDQGAKWPDGVGSQADTIELHWAYNKPVRPPLPEVNDNAWGSNPIDAFVLKKLTEKKLAPSPKASKARLLRRVYLDLIGLPPSVEEIDAFLSDEREDAYSRVVKKLLSSDRFGERWAQPWLDMARYADSNGYQADQYREVWAYRDWVIKALNDNMSYDRFTIEQLAGDLLPNATVAQKTATGFHRMTTCNVEAGVDPEENRVNQIIDRVNTTGTVWLGTTLECAQCHNHKYDPFNMEDYYGLYAFFNNTPLEVKHTSNTTYDFYGPKMPLPLTAEQSKKKQQLVAQKVQLDQRIEELTTNYLGKFDQWQAEQRAELSNNKDNTGADTNQWAVAQIVSFESQNGAHHKVLDDNSVLVSGPRPDKDTYLVEVEPGTTSIRGIKLETLTHDSLPGKGPGRHHPERPNFVLQDLQLEVVRNATETSGQKQAESIALHEPQADFSQSRYHVKGAIDASKTTGWAINDQFHRNHFATFATKTPLDVNEDTILRFKLLQNHGQGRTIGRLRISLSSRIPEKLAPNNSKDNQALAERKAIESILRKNPEKRKAAEQKRLRQYFLSQFDDLQQLKEQASKIAESISKVEPSTTLVMIEMNKSRMTRVFKRGEFLNPGREVSPRTPRILHGFTEETTDRLALARWIVSTDNPLTARVAVNRWWAEIFGHGIVRTLEDFGSQGDLPTHPELLDWLAVEFMDSGWDMKHVLEIIVTSSTYQQSSRVSQQHLKFDPENRWLSRMARVRMPAEMVRDNGLAISGLLSTNMGGVPVFPPQPSGVWRHVGRNSPKYTTATDENRFRRGVYVIWRRSAPYASFVNFDAPDRAACVVKRPRTNTPLQALTLLNDEAYVEMAWGLARKVVDLANTNSKKRMDYAFRSCLSRYPTPAESEFLQKVFEEQRAGFKKSPASAKRLIGNNDVPAKVTESEFAAWFFIANTLLNLDETITKN